jgi:respiratory burst oxidase
LQFVTSATSIPNPTPEKAISYFTFFGLFLFLHAVRIFHIFYATATPQSHDRGPKKDVDEIESITGIWITRKYSDMSFAVTDLVDSVAGLSPAFSLQLYCTRELPRAMRSIDPMARHGSQHFLQAGRPDWLAIMTEALDKAHETNPEGESVGVFFSGSPAIARELQRVAMEATIRHLYASQEMGVSCKCRLHVHKDCF